MHAHAGRQAGGFAQVSEEDGRERFKTSRFTSNKSGFACENGGMFGLLRVMLSAAHPPSSHGPDTCTFRDSFMRRLGSHNIYVRYLYSRLHCMPPQHDFLPRTTSAMAE